ncbi:hypothetical protein HYDPIDRAFT_32354 [Hydnomerulius pinastri MD-312]|uniref:DUF7918 domain-containing protein n=1 Tax=Hydnomerulius pinastri MD-312 TaxID=994086 RepID=A0A0C9V4H3_9AGAM|nr:hypothetical protein HYDPIDRAFT_32354 [Hydnomerulius pinastri MD-312]
MLQLRTFRAGIRVDGEFLQAYDVEMLPEENKVTCWVASEAGKNFSVVWQDLNFTRHFNLLGELKVDGTWAGGKLFKPLLPNQPVSSTLISAELKFVNTSPTTARPLAFSKLQTTDEDQYLKSAPSGLGEITLTIRLVAVLGVGLQQGIGSILNTKVHERSKKAFSHCIGFGDETTVPVQHAVQVQPLTQKPFVTFVFKYRPLDRLMADGIAPALPLLKRAAPEVDDGEDEKPDSSQDDAMREIATLREQVKKLEVKLINARKASGKRVKVEDSDVIDLTCC